MKNTPTKHRDVDDLILQITNDLKYYQVLVSAVKHFYQKTSDGSGGDHYRAYRSFVFNILKKIDPTWSCVDRIYTSVITENLFMHYFEEASGSLIRHNTLKNIREHYPEYVHRDLEKYEEMTKPHENPCLEIPLPGPMFQHELNVNFTDLPQPTKGIDMYQGKAVKAPVIEVKTFIEGRESSTVSDEQIYGLIQMREAEIKALDAIENQPKTLKDKIAGIKAEIKQLVDFVDKRSSAPEGEK